MRIASGDDDLGAGPTYSGIIVPRVEALVGFQVPGRVVARMVDVGARVAAGTPLARLDARDLALGVESARAALRAADAESQTAAADLARARELHAQRVIADAALERAVAAAASTAARRDDARARVATAENGAQYAILVAPTNGIVTATLAEVGQVVAAGQPAVGIAREGEVEVAADLPERQIQTVRAGAIARVSLVVEESDGAAVISWQARVREVAPAADPMTGTYRVRLSLMKGGAPLPTLGRSASVRFTAPRRGGTYSIPATAVVRTRSIPSVWVLGDKRDHVQLRTIEIASMGDGQVIVRRGLAAGDEIVVSGANRLDSALVVTPWTGRLP
ncbi:efflux RND transporter periplasmic adaptor subunit [Gemmatimonas groenlandica]|uniref:Efflux RND transporter periplasmic adaptor subunit n=1 Tax=Gemmatimonas groenlandica TaxID=2732249 RepID=A0A6M4IT32_9BACT|nr:efflux RND transporter periplasmic adaptor subunit [Gemmatimonas groenlandica]QJR37924.1 efflux RND transporter periplasmic adaptor subunit [Gemmatimonas groenlandica]